MTTRIRKLEPLVETDDEEEVERLSDQIAEMACDEPAQDSEHPCRLPWFRITSVLGDE